MRTTPREFFARLRDWFRRDALEGELADELRFHREHLERDAAMGGASAAAAPYVARRRLGNLTRVREDARERWSIPSLDHLQQDIRYALRGLRRSPTFTATVAVTLGLGLGANAAMFGVVDRLMFRPLPYLRDPSRAHMVYLQSTGRRRESAYSQLEYTRYLDLARWTSSFSQVAAFSNGSMAVGTGESARELPVARVSASLFGFFDARPALGRFFGASEDATPRGSPVAVLGYGFWKTEFGGRNVIGQPLQIGTVVSTIVGVAPEGFVGVSSGPPPAAFIPITSYAGNVASQQGNMAGYYTRYNWSWARMIVRRKPGVSVDAASADLAAAHARSWNLERQFDDGLAPVGKAHPSAIAGPLRVAAGPEATLESRTLLWVTGVAVIVLLIACANVANLMVARLLARRREIAVRVALGVGKRRLAMQSLTESLILAALGAATGLAIAQWGGAALRGLVLPDQSGSAAVADWRTLAATALLALFAAVVTAAGPMFLATRSDIAGALKAGARGGGASPHRSRTRAVLLVTQASLSVILLVGAGLFVRSLRHVRAAHLGYEPESVLVVSTNLRGVQLDSAARVALRRRLAATAEDIPGVERAASATSVPLLRDNSREFHVPGIDSVRKLGRFNDQIATPSYFAAMGTRIVRGRAFTDADRPGTPRVIIVSQSMARVLWPGVDAIGQCVRVGPDTAPCSTVIGIAEDVAQISLTDEQRFMFYLPLEQYSPANGGTLLVRASSRHASAISEAVRRELQRVMPGAGYVVVNSLEDVVDDNRRSWALGAAMFVAFGVLAVLVAAVGLYGVLAYNVAQRMHELGVRIALGAGARDVVRLVVSEGISLAAAGAAIGLAVAAFAARWIQPLLFEQSARDPATYAGVGALIVGVALVASAAPALRATRADPNTALRSE